MDGTVGSSSSPRWDAVLAQLRDRMRSDLFERWILPLHATEVGNDLVLESPDAYHRNFVADNYREMLEPLAEAVLEAAQKPLFRIRFAAPESTARPSAQ